MRNPIFPHTHTHTHAHMCRKNSDRTSILSNPVQCNRFITKYTIHVRSLIVPQHSICHIWQANVAKMGKSNGWKVAKVLYSPNCVAHFREAQRRNYLLAFRIRLVVRFYYCLCCPMSHVFPVTYKYQKGAEKDKLVGYFRFEILIGATISECFVI